MDDDAVDDDTVGDREGESKSEIEGTQKVAAVCSSCGSAYAAERWSDGTIRPIGRRTGCQCGGTSFEVVEDSSSNPDPSSS
ncbi:hypothetical protein [Natronosalvus rutilus]|uniref:Uncharacterized protein n=1 Tax=Natronosalvus rutilus TaxID=2953753 RepID=A0A9E7NBA2_9EURY|nr:hypothetical protein [Natronosalvus rutilus]UTF54246.1 hypothetical protein NGM29_02865 [Natronosalvus rutilus]